MLELLNFALSDIPHFLGTTFYICLFYALFGSTGFSAFKEFLSFRQNAAEVILRKAQIEADTSVKRTEIWSQENIEALKLESEK